MENLILEIKKNRKEKRLELITLLTILLYWTAAFYRYTKIPDTIPIHYDIDGSIDNYGSKIFIFIFPFLATIIYFLLSIVTKSPHKFTYNMKITDENAERQYRNVLQMMRTMNLSVILSFFFIDAPILFTEDGISKELNGFYFIIMGILPILTVAYYMSKSYKLN